MTVAETAAPSALDSEPRTRRWTRDEYVRLIDMGLFHGRRVQLIDGEIVEMSPQNEPHAKGILLTDRELRRVFGPNVCIRVQMPLAVTGPHVPEPDVAVVPGDPRDYDTSPSQAALLVEVSDTTLVFDRGRKASLYARHGIADYWIVNLVNRQLEVYRDPMPDAAHDFGFRYATAMTLQPGQSAAPLAAPTGSIRVEDLLP